MKKSMILIIIYATIILNGCANNKPLRTENLLRTEKIEIEDAVEEEDNEAKECNVIELEKGYKIEGVFVTEDNERIIKSIEVKGDHTVEVKFDERIAVVTGTLINKQKEMESYINILRLLTGKQINYPRKYKRDKLRGIILYTLGFKIESIVLFYQKTEWGTTTTIVEGNKPLLNRIEVLIEGEHKVELKITYQEK